MATKRTVELLDGRKRPFGAAGRDFARGMREALVYLATHPWSTYLVWLLIGVSLAFPAGLWLLYSNVNEKLLDMEAQVGYTVYLELDVSSERMAMIADVLGQDPRVEQVKGTSSQAALEELIDLSGLPEIMTEADFNPLPASLSVRVDPDVSDRILNRMQEQAQQIEGVAEVLEDRYWIERTSMLMEILTRLNLVAGLFFGVSAVLIAAAAVRLAIQDRVEELRLLNLIGSPKSYQRKLFQFCGLFYGTGGGLMTSLLLVFVIFFLQRPIGESGTASEIEVALTGFDWRFVVVLIAISASVGVLGASLSAYQITRKLRQFNEV